MTVPRLFSARSIGVGATLGLMVAVPGTMTLGQSQPPGGEPAVSVAGTSTLVGQVDAGTTTIDNGVVRTRDSVLITVEASSDPRVAGRATIVLNIDAYVDAAGVGTAQVRFGTMRLENDKGAWEGRFAGRLTERGFTQTYWLEGEDAYEGLSYVVTAGGNGPVWRSYGLIYPGALPPLSGGDRFDLDGLGLELPVA